MFFNILEVVIIFKRFDETTPLILFFKFGSIYIIAKTYKTNLATVI